MSTDFGVTLVRNATVPATVGETTFLVDSLFAPQGSPPPIDTAPTDRANPLVSTPGVDLSHDAVIHVERSVTVQLAREDLRSETEDVLVPADGERIRL